MTGGGAEQISQEQGALTSGSIQLYIHKLGLLVYLAARWTEKYKLPISFSYLSTKKL